MSIIVGNEGDGPRLHALIVGVGSYPNCPNQRAVGATRRLLEDVRSVGVAPNSAIAVAEWFLSVPRMPSDPPLGTIEVLVSPSDLSQRAVVKTSDGLISVTPATFSNVRAAARGWFERCNSNLNNVALFYFCGHGWRREDQLLLLEDFGESPNVGLGDNCVNFHDLYVAMEYCRARTQCFVVDACRHTPEDLVEHADLIGQRLISPGDIDRLSLPPRDAPILFSVAPGQKAGGPKDQITPFTRALIKTLNGLGAERTRSGPLYETGPWRIFNHQLGPKLAQVMEWERDGIDSTMNCFHQIPSTEGMSTYHGVLRTLVEPPVVPFRFHCQPAEATLRGSLEVKATETGIGVAVQKSGIQWSGDADAGQYTADLQFGDESYHSEQIPVVLQPPCFGQVIRLRKGNRSKSEARVATGGVRDDAS